MALQMNPLRWAGWKKAVIDATVASAAIFLVNLAVAYFFGSEIWLYAGYFFGTSIQTTLSTLLFAEDIIILVLGFVWVSGAMESLFDGSNITINPYRRHEQWKQRPDELDQQNTAGKAMLLTGAQFLQRLLC